MEICRDGVEIDILPETAKCCADDAERNPLNINMCPIGDRGYKVGDKVVLKEWKDDKYLGGEIHGVIKYMNGDEFEGLQDGYVVFSIGIYKIVRSAD